MNTTPRLALVAAIALAAAPSTSWAQNGDDRARRVDSAFAEWNKAGSPGLALAVVRDGHVLIERGYGHANLEHNVRITPATVFDVASVSKQFTGLAIAMLVDQGRINLKDDIRKYLPEMRDIGQTITVDHLVHHTSGLRDWPGTLAIAGWRLDDVIAFDQILRMAYNQQTLNFAPGAEHTYSNTGYNLLAAIVARVTGKSFRAWTDENLFRPLGMTGSHFHDDHAMVVPNRAFGYSRSDSGWRAVTNNLEALGSSSLFSTATDMAKWLANFDDPKVGGQRPMQLMRTMGRLNNGTQIPYAFGISHNIHRGQGTLSHSGGWAGFASYVVHYPQKRFGVVVLANTGAVPVQQAANTLANIYLGTELAPDSPTGTMAGQPEVAVARETLDGYTGIYRLGPGWYVRIRRDGGTLRTQATREAEFPLSARTESTFWVAGYSSAMTFQRDSAGAMSVLYRGNRAPRMGAEYPPRRGSATDLAGEYVSDELQTSYRVEVKDTSVTLRHRRHGDIALTRAYADDYAGAMWFVPSVEFERDAARRVTAMVINNGARVRNVRFVKR